MKYLDTGSRDPDQTLGRWFEQASAEGVLELRLQTGYFSFDGLAPIGQILNDLLAQDRPVTCLVGSNGGATLADDIVELAHCMGSPRQNARLGVVGFEGSGLFHPKVFHIVRSDGSQIAYVGSANLTDGGVSRHIEAACTIDSRTDGLSELQRIADAIDEWFGSPARPGFTHISSRGDIATLEASGVLASTPRPRVRTSSSTSSPSVGSKLQKLLHLKKIIRRVTAKPTTPPPIVIQNGVAPVPVTVATTPQTSTVIAPAPTGGSVGILQGQPAASAVWSKTLSASDAQRKPTGNQRGSITLVAAGHPINAQTYFRRDFFRGAAWTIVSSHANGVVEVAEIEFDTTILGRHLGILRLRISYDSRRESSQANYTTLLHLNGLTNDFAKTNFTHKTIELKRDLANRFELDIF